MTKISITTIPKPHFLLAEQHQKWTVSGAISELVDNALGAGRGNASMVVITLDRKAHGLIVFDDGAGMDDIGRLFQLGNTIGRSPNDIGIYGAGGTKALLWLGKIVDVWSLRNNVISHAHVKWADLRRHETLQPIDGTMERATIRNTPQELAYVGHGTLLRISLLDERSLAPSSAGNIQRDLSRTYSPALRQGRTILWHNRLQGKADTSSPTPLTDAFDMSFKKAVHIDFTIEFKSEHLPVWGEIGIIPDHPLERCRIAVGFAHRIILSTRDCYEFEDEKFTGKGVVGWVQLGDGWQPYLATTKDAINDSPLYDVLMATIFKEIRPLLEEVEDDSRTLILDDLRLNLSQALNLESDHHIEVLRQQKEKPEPEPTAEPEPETGTEPPDEVTPPPADKPEPDNENGTPKDKPAITQIVLVGESDIGMQGLLCTLLRSGDDIAIAVNIDHLVIQEAMKAKPINRMALNLLCTREIANMLADEEDLYKKIFPRGVVQILNDMDEITRERYMARLLIDRVHSAFSQAAE